MESYKIGKLVVTIHKRGEDRFSKVSYPLRYGRFSEISTPDYTYQFNLNGEIKYLKGTGPAWPNPSEWLKRTLANDWVYYSTGGYNGVFESTGEYYIPCFSYPTNSVMGGTPFALKPVNEAIESIPELLKTLNKVVLATPLIPPSIKNFITDVCENTEQVLAEKSDIFHKLISGMISVLPPDARHVDYQVIPVTISDGCLYNCSFCRVKTGKNFKKHEFAEIKQQLEKLKTFYGADVKNYNSIFLGQHDALMAGEALICSTARAAFDIFKFKNSYIKTPRLFLFGSVDSLLRSPESIFAALNKLEYLTYINIGLESADEETLAILGKPISVANVHLAFKRMMSINKQYPNIEVSANFIMDDELPDRHYKSLDALCGKGNGKNYNKGAIYLSPLSCNGDARSTRHKFNQFKLASRLPAYLYLIQRL